MRLVDIRRLSHVHVAYVLAIAFDKAVSFYPGLLATRRRTTWPFHIHKPDRTSTGRKPNLMLEA
jgi:hypothetical protein